MGKVNKTDREWQRELSPEEYRITRKKGTEPAFTGQYWNSKQHGIYVCRCCGAELFSSETKYDSGSGWPSFYRPIDNSAIEEHEDISHGMVEQKLSAMIAMHIWAMCLRMVHSRQDCVIA